MANSSTNQGRSLDWELLSLSISGAKSVYKKVVIDETKAEELIRYLIACKYDRDDHRSFRVRKSFKLTEMGIAGDERSALHSVATRYFKDLPAHLLWLQEEKRQRQLKDWWNWFVVPGNGHIIYFNGRDMGHVPDLEEDVTECENGAKCA